MRAAFEVPQADTGRGPRWGGPPRSRGRVGVEGVVSGVPPKVLEKQKPTTLCTVYNAICVALLVLGVSEARELYSREIGSAWGVFLLSTTINNM